MNRPNNSIILIALLSAAILLPPLVVVVEGSSSNNEPYRHAQQQNAGSLSLRSTALRDSPNENDFYGIGGISYDASTNLWAGIGEGNPGMGVQKEVKSPRLFEFDVTFEPYDFERSYYENNEASGGHGSVSVEGWHEITPGGGLKCEGIARVPSCEGYESVFSPEEVEYWVVSESNSNTGKTNSYFSKRFGNVDLNTFVPGSLADSRLVRVSSEGTLLEEIQFPEWMLWDNVFDWDMQKCYGTRPGKGLHSLAVYEPTEDENLDHTQLITMNQVSLYQDGPEPNRFKGSHVRIMFWDVGKPDDDNDQESSSNNGGAPRCSKSVTYSRSYRYETSRKQITAFQKGADHSSGVLEFLALSATEFLITESEAFEGFGKKEFLSDVFYVKVEAGDTVDHCDSLMDCDVAIPIKRHLLRRNHPYELTGLAWGPEVEKDGMMVPTIAMNFEDDNWIGILMELYTIDTTLLELEPVWENNVNSTVFIRQRVSVLAAACALFFFGVVFQFWFIRRQLAKERVRAGPAHNDNPRNDQSPPAVPPPPKKLGYNDYVLASSVVNSCLLGGVVFGFPGLVLILRKEGIYAEVCSCGVFCAGQQEQISIISTIGFGCAIMSRLFAGIFLDKFGPKITGVCSGLTSMAGLILIATAADVTVLTERITPAWIILAVGGSSMHLTSFHITNLQPNLAEKRKASLCISAGFGAGSLVLPVLQVIHQYGNVKLQTICAFYACIAVLLTINCFFVQPWRAWNSIGTEAAVDLDFLSSDWWPSSIMELTAIRKKAAAKFPPLKEVLRSFEFWGECAWFSAQLFLLTYYLSTISQILFSLGDAKVNQNVDSLLNNMVTRASVFFNGFGWLWSPIVGYLMKTKSVYFRVYLEIAMAFAMSLMLTVPIIEVQMVVFLVQALVRLQLFSNHFAYLGERFGFRFFGLLNGISSLVAGAFGLLGFWLQIFSVFIANGNFGLSYFIVAGLVLSSTFFPFILKRKDKAKELAAIEESNDKRPMEVVESTHSQGQELGGADAYECDSAVEDPGYEAFLNYLYDNVPLARIDENKSDETEVSSATSVPTSVLLIPVENEQKEFC